MPAFLADKGLIVLSAKQLRFEPSGPIRGLYRIEGISVLHARVLYLPYRLTKGLENNRGIRSG
jgi:hypothetical protein